MDAAQMAADRAVDRNAIGAIGNIDIDLLGAAHDHRAVPVDALAEPVPYVELAQAVMRHGGASSRLVGGDDGLDIDLDQHLGQGKAVDDETGAAGKDAFEMSPDDVVDRLAIGAVGDIGGDLADISHLGAGLLEKNPDVLHRLISLRRRIALADEFIVEVEAGLAAQEDDVSG